ncbi:MAG: hypothetical protein ACK5XH_11495, partial [Lysobacteraceae bacterium]
LALAVGIVLCHAFAQGGFYWFSAAVAAPTVGGWWANFTDWLPAYARVAAGYTAVAAIAHVAFAAARLRAAPAAAA